MKKLIAVIGLLILCNPIQVLACEVCKRNQPKGFENITHGAGPTGSTDYIIMWTAVVIVGITLFLSIKYLVKPGEKSPAHIKNIIINEDF